jgi:manganese efflux pump family protein
VKSLGLTQLLFIAVGLSMDAFAMAVCKGLSMRKVTLKKAAVVGFYFGGFQAGMPLSGYFVGLGLFGLVSAFDHWIAFILLAIVGVKTIRESR